MSCSWVHDIVAASAQDPSSTPVPRGLQFASLDGDPEMRDPLLELLSVLLAPGEVLRE